MGSITMREEQLKFDFDDKYKCKFCKNDTFYVEETVVYDVHVKSRNRIDVDGTSGEVDSCILKCGSCGLEIKEDELLWDWN